MSKTNGMVNSGSLRSRDVIEVPVEACQIVKIQRVPGQLKDRRSYLVELTVMPLSGPWANCEGRFIVESNDLIPLIKKYTSKEKRRESWKKFFASLKDRFFSPKVEEVNIKVPSLTGPMT